MTRKLVLFDIDGTILLTAGAGRRAIVAALADAVGTSDACRADPLRRQDRSPDRAPSCSRRRATPAAGDPDAHRGDLRALRRAARGGAGAARRAGHPVMPGVIPLLDRLEAEPAWCSAS